MKRNLTFKDYMTKLKELRNDLEDVQVLYCDVNNGTLTKEEELVINDLDKYIGLIIDNIDYYAQ